MGRGLGGRTAGAGLRKGLAGLGAASGRDAPWPWPWCPRGCACRPWPPFRPAVPAGSGQRRLGRASARRPGTDPSPPLRAWPRGDAQALRPHLLTAPFKPGPRGRKAGQGQARWHTWGAAVTHARPLTARPCGPRALSPALSQLSSQQLRAPRSRCWPRLTAGSGAGRCAAGRRGRARGPPGAPSPPRPSPPPRWDPPRPLPEARPALDAQLPLCPRCVPPALPGLAFSHLFNSSERVL